MFLVVVDFFLVQVINCLMVNINSSQNATVGGFFFSLNVFYFALSHQRIQ